MPALLKVIASNSITDGQGQLLQHGTIYFVATDASNNPIPFRIPADDAAPNRQAVTTPFFRTVTNGTIDGGDLYLANPATTSPADILYRITVTDLVSGVATVFSRVQVSDAGNGTWSFGDWNTGLSSSSVPVSFVVGPTGPAGTIAVGTVAGVAPGSPVAVTNSGVPTAAVLNFQIPQGASGSTSGSLTTFSQVASGIVDGVNPTFAVSVVPKLLFLFLNRVFQIPGVDYTIASSMITFAAAPLPGDIPYAQGIY